MKEEEPGYTLSDKLFEGNCARIYQLLPMSGEAHAPLAQFAKKKKNLTAAAKLADTLQQISMVGIETSIIATGTIRRLDGNIVEVRVPGSVVRAMSYNENGNDILVIVDVFEGHQGSGNIHREIKNAKSKERTVKDLVDKLEGRIP